jgi:UDP-N-acetylmuramate--alanine ligase
VGGGSSLSRVHLLGIGGAGMSSLALHLLHEGHQVSGFDQRASSVTEALQVAGIEVCIGSPATLPETLDRLVISSAIPQHHPLLQAAHQRGLRVVHRSQELSRLFNARRGIAVAGSHGKTTTSALLAHLLSACGEHPSAMIGGQVGGYGANAFLGDGPFVVEADESDGSLLAYCPHHAVVTSVDDDVNVTAAAYADCGYRREKVQQTVDSLFLRFASSCQKSLWVCHDHPRAAALLGQRPRVRTYGLDGSCTLRAETVERGSHHSLVQVYLRGRPLGLLRVPMPGHHNVMNSLAALGVALDLGLRFPDIAHAIAMFRGVGRRFELLGQKNGCACYDDYAHNPQKVTAALQGALQAGRGRVIALFQPHRYTRMKLLGDSFLPALDGADQVILTDVYSSGEEPNGFDISAFHQALVQRAPAGSIHWAPDRAAVHQALDRIARPGDLIISLGAGDCGEWLRQWVSLPALLPQPPATELAA